MKNMGETFLIYMIDETVKYIRLQWCTDGEVDDGLKHCTDCLETGGLRRRKRFRPERLQILHGSINVLRASHVIETFTERIPSKICVSYMNRFYSDC